MVDALVTTGEKMTENITENMTIGNRLKHIRTKKGLTLEKTAGLFQLTKSVLSRYETGGRTPDNEFLEAFGKHFQVNANWLLYNELPIFRETAGYTKDTTETFLELSKLLNLETGQDREMPQSLKASLEKLGESSPQNYITLLRYMHQYPEIRKKVFQFFYIVLKPVIDEADDDNPPGSEDNIS